VAGDRVEARAGTAGEDDCFHIYQLRVSWMPDSKVSLGGVKPSSVCILVTPMA
jgi:hypothetical protein